MLAHHNFIRRESDERSTGHGVMWHDRRDFSFSPVYGPSNLSCRQYETSWGMQNEINRHIRVSQANGANNFL